MLALIPFILKFLTGDHPVLTLTESLEPSSLPQNQCRLRILDVFFKLMLGMWFMPCKEFSQSSSSLRMMYSQFGCSIHHYETFLPQRLVPKTFLSIIPLVISCLLVIV